MRILGVDPGYAIVGFGVLDYSGNTFSTVDYGAVETPAGMPFCERLTRIYDGMSAVIARDRPEAMSVEKLFFNSNSKTAIDVAQARGVILLSAAKSGVPVHEYTPLQVKQAVTGYGRADKRQIMEMTRVILGLERLPKPDDTADALALAICHGHNAGSLLGRLSVGTEGTPSSYNAWGKK